MTRSFHCPNCGAPLDAPASYTPTLRCPYCNSSVVTPRDIFSTDSSDPVLSPGEAFAVLPNLMTAMPQIKQLIQAGNKIEAIKRFRESFGVGLAEAKDAVEQIERGEVVRLTSVNVSSSGHGALDISEIQQLIQAGNKIEAVKRFREQTGLGLKESKDAVDALQVARTLTISPEAARTAVKTSAAAAGGLGCLALGFIAFITLVVFGGIGLAFTLPGGPLEELGYRFNPFASGRLAASFGEKGSGQGQLTDPRRLAVGADGAVFVSDFDSGRVQRFDAEGNFASLWLIPGQPYISALEADRNGFLYVVYGGDVHRHDATTGADQGIQPIDDVFYVDDLQVTPDGGYVVVADGETLLRYNSDGQLVWSVEDAVSSVSNDSELSAYAAADGLGNVYIVGSFNNAVFKYSPEGRFLTQFGSEGDGKSQLRAVNAIAVDGQSRVYVSDIDGIEVFEGDGRFVRTIRVSGVAFDLAFDAEGNLWAVTNKPGVFKYIVE